MNIQEERLKEIICLALDERVRIDACEHTEQHAFIAVLMERERRRQALFDAVQKQLVGWGVIALAGLIGNYVLTHIKIDLINYFR